MMYDHSGIYRDEIKVLNGKVDDLRKEITLLSVVLRTARDRLVREGAVKDPSQKLFIKRLTLSESTQLQSTPVQKLNLSRTSMPTNYKQAVNENTMIPVYDDLAKQIEGFERLLQQHRELLWNALLTRSETSET